MKKIIFVCTGNTCRSPMAEKISQKIAKDRGVEAESISRGLAVFGTEPANAYAIATLSNYGLDLTQHISKSFEVEDIENDILILTMTRQHKRLLLRAYPNLTDRVYGIYEYIGKVKDVEDPYGKPLQAYMECADELYQVITKVFDKLEEKQNDSNR